MVLCRRRIGPAWLYRLDRLYLLYRLGGAAAVSAVRGNCGGWLSSRGTLWAAHRDSLRSGTLRATSRPLRAVRARAALWAVRARAIRHWALGATLRDATTLGAGGAETSSGGVGSARASSGSLISLRVFLGNLATQRLR